MTEVGTGPKVVVVEEEKVGRSWRAFTCFPPITAAKSVELGVALEMIGTVGTTGVVGHGVVVVVRVTSAKVLVTLLYDKHKPVYLGVGLTVDR